MLRQIQNSDIRQKYADIYYTFLGIDMPRAKGSDRLHRLLMWLAMNELRRRGYLTHMDAKLPFGFKCDLLAEKMKSNTDEDAPDRIVVECVLRPNIRMIKKKRDILKGYAKLILVMPRTYYTLAVPEVEVWIYDVTREDAMKVKQYATITTERLTS